MTPLDPLFNIPVIIGGMNYNVELVSNTINGLINDKKIEDNGPRDKFIGFVQKTLKIEATEDREAVIFEGLENVLEELNISGLYRNREHEERQRTSIVLVSPTDKYSYFIIRGKDIDSCIEFAWGYIEDLRSREVEVSGKPDDIDDPVWCLWSDLAVTLAH